MPGRKKLRNKDKAATRLPVDASNRNMGNTYDPPPEYYYDIEFTCQDCDSVEVWRAFQQKWWYEEAGGYFFATAIRCRRSPLQLSLVVRRYDHDKSWYFSYGVAPPRVRGGLACRTRGLATTYVCGHIAHHRRLLHCVQRDGFLAYRNSTGLRTLRGTDLRGRHCCNGYRGLAGNRELALGLDTAGGRLGRVSHSLSRLVRQAVQIVITPHRFEFEVPQGVAGDGSAVARN